jgi:hypothetical protein
MHHVTPTVQRRRWQRFRFAVPAALALLLAGLNAVSADTSNLVPNSATGTVGIGFEATLAYPCTCPVSIAGTSAGDITGTYNDLPFEVAWPASLSNFSGTLSYTTTCEGNVPEVSGIDVASTSITITNATIAYGTQHAAAQVTITFGSSLSTGTDLVIGVGSISFSSSISIPPIVNPISRGLLHLTPVMPAAACITGTQQGYQLSGPIVALQP